MTRRKVAIAAGIVVLALASALAAYAALSLRLPFTGGGSVSAQPQLRFTDAAVESSDLVTCSTAVNGTGFGNSASVQLDNATRGGAVCQIGYRIQRDTGPPLVVQDVEFAGPVDEIFANPAICGASVPNSTTSLLIQVRFTVPLSAPLGLFSATSDAGIKVVSPNAFVPAECPT